MAIFLHVLKLHVRSRLFVTYEFPYLLVLDKIKYMYVTEGFAAKLRSTHVTFQRVEEHLKDQVSFRRRRAHNDLAYMASLSNSHPCFLSFGGEARNRDNEEMWRTSWVSYS